MVDGVLNEDLGDYNITLVATDNGIPPLSDEAQLVVSMRRNLNPPVFLSNYTQNVSEYANIGFHVIRVKAEDQDPITSPSGRLTYELAEGATPGAIDYFMIGKFEDNNVIMVNKSLRGFTGDNMYFRVMAKDGGDPAKTAYAYVHVRILRNEFTPKFSLNDYNATISEFHPKGQVVLTVTATDGDSTIQGATPNSQIKYSIANSEETAKKYFELDPNTGILTVKTSLLEDTDKPKGYSFRIIAQDSGAPVPKSTNATVNIGIRRGTDDLSTGIGFDSDVYVYGINENTQFNQGKITYSNNCCLPY